MISLALPLSPKSWPTTDMLSSHLLSWRSALLLQPSPSPSLCRPSGPLPPSLQLPPLKPPTMAVDSSLLAVLSSCPAPPISLLISPASILCSRAPSSTQTAPDSPTPSTPMAEPRAPISAPSSSGELSASAAPPVIFSLRRASSGEGKHLLVSAR
ncbi:hypothetical protein CSDaVgp3 [Citrus sudden death-associated virus]|uniref:Uncharacterized protein n=1 Tax=Citrus sudden death-associated virus TaxID=312008 RepID=Q5EGG3_9VIRU|nr:hypothetical protein CSDaVgp3 [Citrus sudden death-associated virus]AAW88345.1 hypothetical protein CSDaVgp3 [Citrus sudden death-associated virus]